ncbi:hypothetical protein BOTCAL_0613g00040 [Botryotinia calthae]|uniref:Uncharacterized protein n=1 Tax=Botryotinia calthae TaxID=38488 RepID=A0A4Y8CIJ1_9HELO|nr:hypothetical protein BOTCAL_0613g00040 [Botryotinia calthae]
MSTTSLTLSLGDPIICLNTSCNYPFGRICEDCSFELESRAALQVQAQSKSQSQSQSHSRAQAQDKRNSIPKNRVTKTQTALPKGTTVKSRSLDIPQRVADIVEDLQEIFAFVPAAAVPSLSSSSSAFPAAPAPAPAPAISKKPCKLTTHNLQIFDCTSSPLPLPPFSKPHSTSTSSSFHSSPQFHALNPPTLNTWLDDVVIRTLEGQVLSPSYIGGANEEDEQEALCPYCDSSMGEEAWRELHLINCRYAHVEAERLEIARGGW